MTRILFTVAMVAAFLFAGTGIAQFEEIDHEKRQLVLGAQFQKDEYAINATAVAPASSGPWSGWIGAHLNKLNDDWLGVLRAEGGVALFGTEWTANVFTEGRRDDVAGVERQLQFGYFGESPAYAIGGATVTAGFGNYIDQEQSGQAAEDLGLKPTDESAIRLLGYTSWRWNDVALLIKATPNAEFWNTDARDIQLVIQPTINLKDNITLMTQFEYDSEPLLPEEYWTMSGGIQIGLDF